MKYFSQHLIVFQGIDVSFSIWNTCIGILVLGCEWVEYLDNEGDVSGLIQIYLMLSFQVHLNTPYVMHIYFGLTTTSTGNLTLTLLEANSTNTKECKKPEKSSKLWQMGTHLKVPSESFPMSTNMTGFRWISKFFAFLSIGRM